MKGREIKFRAWDTSPLATHDGSSGVMREHEYVVANCGAYITNDKIFNQRVVMQFTGLHDKNGKEIYEGDVYKAVGLFPTVVIFEDGVFRGKGSQQEGVWYDIETYDNIEIIGNIYENSDLLPSPKDKEETK